MTDAEIVAKIREVVFRQPINMGLSPTEAWERISEIARILNASYKETA
jgi:hypothetical protein